MACLKCAYYFVCHLVKNMKNMYIHIDLLNISLYVPVQWLCFMICLLKQHQTG